MPQHIARLSLFMAAAAVLGCAAKIFFTAESF